MESIKHWVTEYPPSNFILVTGEPETTGEQKAQLIAEEMHKELATPIYNVSIQKINKIDIAQAVRQLVAILNTEKGLKGNNLLNISGSLRTFSVVGYIVACLTQSKLVSVIPKYDESGNEIAIEKHIEIPILPFLPPGEEHLKILSAIGPGIESLEQLVFLLCPHCKKNTQKYNSERARISYYVDLLEKTGHLIRVKQGKTVHIHLTDLGKIYIK